MTSRPGRPVAGAATPASASFAVVRGWTRRYWVELLWVLFVCVNTVGMLTMRDWATVPFHFVWIGLSLLYGWRVWTLPATYLALGTVVLVTGFAMVEDVVLDSQPPDELTEIPLMATVFAVMVWYVRHAITAREQMARVSQHNLALLHRQREFVQDASHLLRTPLTIALGHAELMRASAGRHPDDLDIVIDELHRLKHISDRLLALAATDQPDFIRMVDAPVGALVTRTWSHWSTAHPEIKLGALAPVRVPHDPERLRDGLDELITNAVRHTPPGTPITLSVALSEGGVVVSVADQGPGIPREEQAQVFDRFAGAGRRERTTGLGLGLALVRAIAEAHGGRLSMHSEPGCGTTLALWLPLPAAMPNAPGEAHPGRAAVNAPAAPIQLSTTG